MLRVVVEGCPAGRMGRCNGGCTLCVDLYPQFFELTDEGVRPRPGASWREWKLEIWKASQLCPKGAIRLEVGQEP